MVEAINILNRERNNLGVRPAAFGAARISRSLSATATSIRATPPSTCAFVRRSILA